MAKKLSDVEQKASTKVLGDLRKHMQDMMGDKMKSLKKVTVASDSKDGLKKGLEKAEEILDVKPSEDEIEEPSEEMEDESAEHEAEESPADELSEEEIEARIQELLAKKEKLGKK